MDQLPETVPALFRPRLFWALVLALNRLSILTATAQTPVSPAAVSARSAPAVATIKTTTRLVEADIVVTDSKGRPVTGLAEGDFNVEEDNKTQPIRSFEVHTVAGGPSSPVPKIPPLPPNTYLNLPTASEASTPTVILYDLLNGHTKFGEQEVLKFLERRRPGRQIAIFVLGNTLHMVKGFGEELGATSELQKALQQWVDHRWFIDPDSGQPERITLSALAEVGRFLAEVPGRKNLIWYSAGFPEHIVPSLAVKRRGNDLVTLINPGDNYAGQVREATDLLNLSHVSVYPIDVRGVKAGVNVGGPMSFALQSRLNFDTAVHATMDSVADDTGGHAFYGTNDLEEALDQAMTSGSTYYSLSYAPTNPKYDGSLRHIKVTLKKSGYTLSYRRTYFADDLDAVAKSVADAPPSPLLPALERGLPLAHGLFVEVHLDSAGAPVPATPEQMQVLAQYEAFRTKQKAATAQAPVMMQQYVVSYGLIARQLEMPADDNGARQASLEFGVISYDEDGRKLNGLDTTVDDPLPAERYAKLASDGYRATQTIAVPVTAASIRLAVRDVRSNRMGSIEVKLPLVKTTQAKVG